MCSRSTLVAANSQQRPEACWEVTSSVSISTENFWRIFHAPSGTKATSFRSVLPSASAASFRCGHAR